MKHILPLILLSGAFFGTFCYSGLLAGETTPAEVDEILLSTDKPRRLETARLIGYLCDRNATIREAAVRRLSSFPEETGDQVIETLMEGDLASQLAALEILTEWKLSVGAIDPWRRETLSEAARAALKAEWEKKYHDPKAEEGTGEEDPPKTLTKSQLDEARDAIDRMLRATTDQESTAIRERLYRLGPALLDEVRKHVAANDREYERLSTLRYRLASSPSLPLRWSGGLERLASNDAKTRQKAAEELMEKMEQGDQPLLVELFANPDSMVREISLKGLQKLGTRDSLDALSRLLDDPEPNVRAAILKMAVESPTPAFVREVIKYLDKETDPDLLVHGIRVLKKGDGETTAKVLLKMIRHESWQVRAEAAEALESFCRSNHSYSSSVTYINGKRVEETNENTNPLFAEVNKALLEQLKKEDDAFVLNRLVDRLEGVNMEEAVEPLVGVIGRRPELAEKIIATLAKGTKMQAKSRPHLEGFAKNKDPKVRAAAIKGLVNLLKTQDEKHAIVATGLKDRDEHVRIAVLHYLMKTIQIDQKNQTQVLYNKYNRDENSTIVHSGEWYHMEATEYTPAPSRGGGLGGFFRSIAEGVAEAVKEATPGDPKIEKEKEVDPTEPPEKPQTEPPKAIEPTGNPSVPPILLHVNEGVPPVPSEPLVPLAPSGKVVIPKELLEKMRQNELEVIRKIHGEIIQETAKSVEEEKQAKKADEKVTKKKKEDGGKPSEFTPIYDAYQQWLVDYAKGKGRADWLGKIVPLLEKSLASDSIEERALAAEILVPLGKADKSLDVLLKTVEEVFKKYHDATAMKKADAAQIGELRDEVFECAAKTLSWLPTKKRREVYQKLKSFAKKDSQVRELIDGARNPLDPVIIEDFWAFIEDKTPQQPRSFSNVDYTLSHTFDTAFVFRRGYYSSMGNNSPISGISKEKADEIIKRQIVNGNKKQRLMAFALFQKSNKTKGIELGKQWLDDEKLPDEFRDKVFQVLLIVMIPNDARKLAIEPLKDPKARKGRIKNSLRYLTLGANALEENLSMSGMSFDTVYYSSDTRGKPIVPELPVGVTLEMIKPLLKDKDLEIAGLAGYLVSICNEDEGLPPLLKLWESEKEKHRYGSDRLQRLVYRAIAYLNAEDKIDVLRDIFKNLETYNLSEFYWTIRIMNGDKILKLRKEVREKAGGMKALM